MNPTSTSTAWSVEQTVDNIIENNGAKPSALIMILQDVQRQYRFLPREALDRVAQRMDISRAQIYGVATFYTSFSLEPKGKNHICVCTGTACHVRQARIIIDKLERELKISPGETTEDGQFSIETVNCLGACALGPLITANDDYYGNMTVTKVDQVLKRLKRTSHEPETTRETVEDKR